MARSLPALTEHHLLPVGIHDLTLSQVESLFGGFQRSERRARLFAKLVEYLDELKSAGWNARVIVDGSFVMPAVDEPEDVDIILVLPEDWDMSSGIRPFEYNLIARRRTRRRFGFDVFAVRASSPEEQAMVTFFQQVNVKWSVLLGLPPGLGKGIVRIAP
jgi:hypothetical protein